MVTNGKSHPVSGHLIERLHLKPSVEASDEQIVFPSLPDVTFDT